MADPAYRIARDDGSPSGYTRPRDWAPMTDEEWEDLSGYLRLSGPGRKVRDVRARFDAFFWVARSGRPWHELPIGYGRPDTVHRHFRRLAHDGLFLRLLKALAHPFAPPGLCALEHWICRAYRLAGKIAGEGAAIRLARRLGFLSALRGWTTLMPDPDLSETYVDMALRVVRHPDFDPWNMPDRLLDHLGRLICFTGGRMRITKHMAPP